MKLDHILVYTDTIPILNMDGKQFDEIKLPEKIMPTPRRRCGCSKNHTFYKGAGILYRGNYSNTTDSNMIIVSRNPCEYQKYYIVHPKAYQKFGIFTFCHQPIFSDCEGGCGPKEKTYCQCRKNLNFLQSKKLQTL